MKKVLNYFLWLGISLGLLAGIVAYELELYRLIWEPVGRIMRDNPLDSLVLIPAAFLAQLTLTALLGALFYFPVQHFSR